MFGKSIKLFRLFGFEIRVDFSWVFIVALVTWTLARGFFPLYYRDLPLATYWWMGVVGALGLFVSIVLHELSHSLVARRYGMSIKGITLFIFGGVAEMESEPPNPQAEFWMAIAGPLASVAIALLSYAGYQLGAMANWPVPVLGVFFYLAIVNGLLVAFNLVPAFPLDGGRVLRAILWAWKQNVRWATLVTSNLGSVFGTTLILLGILHVLFGNPLSGVWWVLIGMFLRGASQASYQQLLVRKALEGEPVSRFMVSEPITVEPSTTIDELVEQYIYRFHHKLFPVVEDTTLLGCVTTRQVKQIPPSEWKSRRVEELMADCSPDNTIAPEADAMDALSMMNRTGASRLMVVNNGRLVGILSLKDMLKFIAIRVDLEQEG